MYQLWQINKASWESQKAKIIHTHTGKTMRSEEGYINIKLAILEIGDGSCVSFWNV